MDWTQKRLNCLLSIEYTTLDIIFVVGKIRRKVNSVLPRYIKVDSHFTKVVWKVLRSDQETLRFCCISYSN